MPEHHGRSHQFQSAQERLHLETANLQAVLDRQGFRGKTMLEQRIADRAEQVARLHRAKHRVAEEMQATHEAMAKRLEIAVSPWISTLDRELADIKRDFKAYEAAVSTVQLSDKLAFLQSYKFSIDALLNLAGKPHHPETEFDLRQVPRELDQIRSEAREYLKLEYLNQAKNQAIWDISRGMHLDTESSVKREVTQWSRLVERISDKLGRLRMRCYFCKAELDEASVNEPCKQNPSTPSNQFLKDPTVPPQHLGSSYHYFRKD